MKNIQAVSFSVLMAIFEVDLVSQKHSSSILQKFYEFCWFESNCILKKISSNITETDVAFNLFTLMFTNTKRHQQQ